MPSSLYTSMSLSENDQLGSKVSVLGKYGGTLTTTHPPLIINYLSFSSTSRPFFNFKPP